MELIEVDPLDAQRLERGLKLLANSRDGEVLGAVEEPVEVMAELGGHKPKRAVVTAEIIADQAFGKVVAVAFGGVDQVHASLPRLMENGIGLTLGKGRARVRPPYRELYPPQPGKRCGPTRRHIARCQGR